MTTETETTDAADYGLIDETTPVGRVYEFGPDAPEHIKDETATLIMCSASTVVILVGGEDVILTREQWQEDWAPHVEGFTDPVSEKGEIILTAEQANELRLAAADRREAEAAYVLANETAKALKKHMEGSQQHERDLIDKLLCEQPPMPLFDGRTDDESWRDAALDRLGIDEKLVAKLACHGAGIKTMGQLADFTGDQWNRLTDIAGVGEAGAKAVEDACEQYWADRRVIES